jgi:hypothetical protein
MEKLLYHRTLPYKALQVFWEFDRYDEPSIKELVAKFKHYLKDADLYGLKSNTERSAFPVPPPWGESSLEERLAYIQHMSNSQFATYFDYLGLPQEELTELMDEVVWLEKHISLVACNKLWVDRVLASESQPRSTTEEEPRDSRMTDHSSREASSCEERQNSDVESTSHEEDHSDADFMSDVSQFEEIDYLSDSDEKLVHVSLSN